MPVPEESSSVSDTLSVGTKPKNHDNPHTSNPETTPPQGSWPSVMPVNNPLPLPPYSHGAQGPEDVLGQPICRGVHHRGGLGARGSAIESQCKPLPFPLPRCGKQMRAPGPAPVHKKGGRTTGAAKEEIFGNMSSVPCTAVTFHTHTHTHTLCFNGRKMMCSK